jgi:hypothetical protein
LRGSFAALDRSGVRGNAGLLSLRTLLRLTPFNRSGR